MSADLSKFIVNVDAILAQKKAIEDAQAARQKSGNGELIFKYLKPGEGMMFRLVPLIGGRLSKEVWRYRHLGEDSFISPKLMAGVDDPFSIMKDKLEERCSHWRSFTKEKYGKESPQYKVIEEFTKTIWSEAFKLRATVEHYVLIIEYTNYISVGPGELPKKEDLSTYSAIQIFKESETTHLKLLALMAAPFYQNPSILDFQQGRRLFVQRTGAKLDTEYAYTAEGSCTPFPDTNLLETSPDLDVVFKPAKPADLTKALQAQGYDKLLESIDPEAESLLAEVSTRAGGTVPQLKPAQGGASPANNPGGTSSAPPETPPPAFVAAWLTTKCSVCGNPQFTTTTGHTCSGNHPNAAGV